MRRPKHMTWLIAFTAIVGLAAVGLMFFVFNTPGGTVADQAARANEIPPTFGASRIFFAVLLAMLFNGSALSAGAIIENFRYLLVTPGSWRLPAKVGVVNETLLLGVILMGIFPDALVLFAWGESSAPMNSVLSRIDRAFDAIAILTFIIWLWRRTRSRPLLLFQLQREPIPVNLEPTWQQLRPKLINIFVIVVISFGVAFGK